MQRIVTALLGGYRRRNKSFDLSCKEERHMNLRHKASDG